MGMGCDIVEETKCEIHNEGGDVWAEYDPDSDNIVSINRKWTALEIIQTAVKNDVLFDDKDYGTYIARINAKSLEQVKQDLADQIKELTDALLKISKLDPSKDYIIHASW